MSMLGIVIEDVPTVRAGLKKALQEAGCEKVEALGNTKRLLTLLKKEPGDRLVILVSDLMDSKEAGKQRYSDAVLAVAKKRVKELANARNVAPAAKLIVYSLAPTLAAASVSADSSEHLKTFVDWVREDLKLADDDFVGKLGPGPETFEGSQEVVTKRVREMIATDEDTR